MISFVLDYLSFNFSTAKKNCAELYKSGEKKSAVCTQSILMVQGPLMCSVTKKRPVGGGQCSKRDWTARLISTVAGMITSVVLVT